MMTASGGHVDNKPNFTANSLTGVFRAYSPFMWNFEQISNEEIELQRKRYEPLTESVRQLIDATVRTEADDETVAAAKAEIDSAIAKLRHHQRNGGWGVRFTPDGTGLAWGDAATGLRNPFAPPMVVEHDGPEKVHSDFRVGAAYEGPPNHLHGGLSALFLDHVLGGRRLHPGPLVSGP